MGWKLSKGLLWPVGRMCVSCIRGADGFKSDIDDVFALVCGGRSERFGNQVTLPDLFPAYVGQIRYTVKRRIPHPCIPCLCGADFADVGEFESWQGQGDISQNLANRLPGAGSTRPGSAAGQGAPAAPPYYFLSGVCTAFSLNELLKSVQKSWISSGRW